MDRLIFFLILIQLIKIISALGRSQLHGYDISSNWGNNLVQSFYIYSSSIYVIIKNNIEYIFNSGTITMMEQSQ